MKIIILKLIKYFVILLIKFFIYKIVHKLPRIQSIYEKPGKPKCH